MRELPKMPNPKFCGDRFFAYQLEQYRSEMKQQLKCDEDDDCFIRKLLRENLRQRTEEYKRVGRELDKGIRISQTLHKLFVKIYANARERKEIAEKLLLAFEDGTFTCPIRNAVLGALE